MRAQKLRPALGLMLLAIVTGIGGGAPAYAAPPAPAITPSTSAASDGEEITVELTGWSPGIVVSVAICGSEGQSAACATDTTGQVVPDDAGASSVLLPVTVPPAPCPCTVQAISVDGGSVSVPFEVVGAPVAAPVDEASTTPREPELDGTIQVFGSPSWGEQFAFGGSRSVLVTVTNSSAVPSEEGELDIVLGRNTRSGDVAASFDIPSLSAGESFEVSGDISLPAGSTGQYVVYVVGPGSVDALAYASMESWAVLGAAAVGMLAAFVWALAGVRRPAAQPRGVRFLERAGVGLVVATVTVGLAALYPTLL